MHFDGESRGGVQGLHDRPEGSPPAGTRVPETRTIAVFFRQCWNNCSFTRTMIGGPENKKLRPEGEIISYFSELR